jgi:hypothetical protein
MPQQALSTQFVKLKIDNTVYCIKSFPDIDPHGNPDQIETTDLCSEYHEFIDGLKNYGDDLEFGANYDEAKFQELNAIGTTHKAVDILLCSDKTDETGANGKFSMTEAEVAVRLNGGGVGDVMEMTIVIKPKSAITFATVA